ncbi:hypothetical protein BcDW1_2298 [Botrytis cinerea BcDW1]|uniref:Uncharacterized protein n=1 Tax=Botryotinia fuckeliana (strain BcDW1) TaxID=1290391 RepID=M7UYP3_BOTF1|nr:hypothetical protein BcDW1_2298 [Botrytis cinerea BcDW1]
MMRFQDFVPERKVQAAQANPTDTDGTIDALGGGTGENRENPKMMIKNAWKGNNTWDICCLQSRGQRNSPY